MTILQERASTARRAMIDSQLRVSGVNDPALLAALDRVPREDFVPAAQRDHAYIDRALPLDGGHALPAPLFQGLALTEAAPQPGETVLVVSPAGYLGALVAELGCTVTTVSPAEAVAGRSGAPVSLILVDGAIEQVPAALAARLAEGGRIIAGIVERGVTRLAAGAKVGDAVSLLALTDIGIPVLPEFAAPKSWNF